MSVRIRAVVSFAAAEFNATDSTFLRSLISQTGWKHTNPPGMKPGLCAPLHYYLNLIVWRILTKPKHSMKTMLIMCSSLYGHLINTSDEGISPDYSSDL